MSLKQGDIISIVNRIFLILDYDTITQFYSIIELIPFMRYRDTHPFFMHLKDMNVLNSTVLIPNFKPDQCQIM